MLCCGFACSFCVMLFFVLLMYVCFYCVCFFSTMLSDSLKEHFQNDLFCVEWIVETTSIKSISGDSCNTEIVKNLDISAVTAKVLCILK